MKLYYNPNIVQNAALLGLGHDLYLLDVYTILIIESKYAPLVRLRL